ncbi:MAG: toll/interleukin-1 receptor domain-containing protein [Bacteroidia bacterium]|nr:toll/interleukin-1 receptor domain-containing protein [Bacteroidia bacterium]
MKTHFRSPLTVYALWHPEFSEGKLLASNLFNTFSRDTNDPFSRTMGLPVCFRSLPGNEAGERPLPINFNESQHTAVVVFVDDNMVISPDWANYVEEIARFSEGTGGKVRVFPVATGFNSFKFPVSSTNYIRLFEVKQKAEAPPPPKEMPSVAAETKSKSGPRISQTGKSFSVGTGDGRTINININLNLGDFLPEEDEEVMDLALEAAPVAEIDLEWLQRKSDFLAGKLSHELSRMLYEQPIITDEGTVKSSPPVRLFISHAKADGAEIAEAIRNYIHSDTSLKSFFDANDIAVGYRFSEELLSAIEESALICLQTDYYATREWCLWEVINAKRLDRPVVVANAVKEREPRTFPYIGNVPTMRWDYDDPDQKKQIQEIIDLAMFEVLSAKYHDLFQRELIRVFELPEDTGVVGHPPELFTILKMNKNTTREYTAENPRLVIYPDPPLGDEEIRVLEDLAPYIKFITPTMISLMAEKHPTS